MLALAYNFLAAASDDDFASSSPAAGRTQRRLYISAALVARLQSRDSAAFDELFQTAYAPLVAVAFGITEKQDVAEDVVQDVFVWLWEKGSEWNPGSTPAAYLIGAVRHRALNARRRHNLEIRHTQQVAGDMDTWTGKVHATDWSAEEHALEAALQRALRTMTERQRTAFVLRAEQQMSVPEVADALGIGVRAAEKLVSRTMRAVRDELSAIFGR